MKISLYQSPSSVCGYYEDKQCINHVADPEAVVSKEHYQLLINSGFRRAGEYIYRPACVDCDLCQSTRIDCRSFQLSKSQKRILKRNNDLEFEFLDLARTTNSDALYRRYISWKHTGGLMDNMEDDPFDGFFDCSWMQVKMLQIKSDGVIVAQMITDELPLGYSAVYSFYDPEYSQRSLGKFLILKLIELCQAHDLQFVYPGFWINGHPKMHYKAQFDSTEIFSGSSWNPFIPCP